MQTTKTIDSLGVSDDVPVALIRHLQRRGRRPAPRTGRSQGGFSAS